MKLEFPSSYANQELGFEVGDFLTFPDGSQSPMVITEIHVRTPEEEAEMKQREEMAAREAELFDNTCPECGHRWDDDEDDE